MNWLSNRLLIDAYKKAIELEIEEDFQSLLRDELKSRGINLFRVRNKQQSEGEQNSES